MKIEMRKFFVILAAIIAASCSLEDDEKETLYQSYGLVREDSQTSGKLYIRSDNGKVILPSQSNLLSNSDRDSRVWIAFYTNSDINSDTIKANISDFLKITEMDFKTQIDESALSASDNVYLQEMWVAQDYLTLTMDVKAGSENSLKNHKYTMFLNEKSEYNIEEVSDTVHLEFIYDRNNDVNSQSFVKTVTLKLDDKVNAKILAVRYRTDSGIKEKFVTYTK
jgi:hypothetical protein